MAKQKGIVKIKGTMGDITFFKTQDGYMVKEKSSISKERLMNDEAFERTRENMSEFKRAGIASKLLRGSVEDILVNCKDNRVTSRMVARMLEIIKADAVNPRGKRVTSKGPLALFKGFEFNVHAGFSQTIKAGYVPGIDRPSGKLSVNIPAFIPANMILQPQGTTHFKIISAGAEVNFDDNVKVSKFFESVSMPINNLLTADIQITHDLTPNSTNPLFLFLGIKFHQEVNGNEYVLKNSSYNAFQVIDVNQV